MEELQGVPEEKVKKAFAEYQQGCQWFLSALDKYDITHDRKLTLGGKVENSVSAAVLASFQSFLFSASSKWTVRPASMLLRRWINCLSLHDATELEAMHCLHVWDISMYLNQILAMYAPCIYLSYHRSHPPSTLAFNFL